MITDRIPASTIFSSHTQADGSNIGGVAPASLSITPVPGRKPSWLMQTAGSSDATGKGYPAVLFYPAASAAPNAHALGRPIQPNFGNLELCFDQWVDTGAAAGANVYETDTLLVIEGLKFNLSGQRHNKTGEIDDGNWTDTGLRLGPLTPNVKHRVKWIYSFSLTAKTCSILGYECDGVVSPIAAKFQNMPAEPCNWPSGVYPQFQLGSLPAGLPWAMRIGNIRYHWF